MTKPKNRSIPQIPKPAPVASAAPGGSAPENETKPASELTKSALQLLRQSYSDQAEVLANQAAKVEGIDPAEGWKLDMSGVWFRPKPAAKPA